jgi:hypothetical protein
MKYGLGPRTLLISLLSLNLIGPHPQSTANSFAIINSTPNGPADLVASAGTGVSRSSRFTEGLVNPAGLALNKWWGEIAVDINTLQNQSDDLNSDGDFDNLRNSLYFWRGALHFGRVSFGLIYDTPFVKDIQYTEPLNSDLVQRKLTLVLKSVDIPLSYQFSKEFAIGTTWHTRTALLRFQSISSNPLSQPIDLATESDTLAVTLGLLYRHNGKRWAAGLAHTPQHSFSVDTDLNTQVTPAIWFRNISVPARTTIGFHYQPSPRLTLQTDLSLYHATSGYIPPGDQVTSSSSSRRIEANTLTSLKFGSEWRAIEKSSWLVILFLGTYMEPQTGGASSEKHHVTTGARYEAGQMSVNLGVDSARGYFNLAGGLSFNFKALF